MQLPGRETVARLEFLPVHSVKLWTFLPADRPQSPAITASSQTAGHLFGALTVVLNSVASEFPLADALLVAYKTNMAEFPELPCFCGSLRRVERLLMRRYEEHVRPSGVSMGQFALLMIVDQAGPISQQRLGDMLSMDKATLSRNLQAMLEQDFLQAAPGDDRRTKQISITPAGRKKKEEAIPLWQAAQDELKAQLGDDFTRFLKELNALPERINR